MSNVGNAQASRRLRPRFCPADRNELLRTGITTQQIRELDYALGLIHDSLAPLPRSNDVRDELEAMANTLTDAEQRLRRWRQAPAGRSAGSEALGHFGMAAAPFVRSREADEFGVDLRDDLDPAALIEIVAALARRAVGEAPTARRTQTRAAPEAVRLIVQALQAPNDEWSVKAAARLAPSRSGAFLALACVVWRAALGPDSVASPVRSIQAYLSKSNSAQPADWCPVAGPDPGRAGERA